MKALSYKKFIKNVHDGEKIELSQLQSLKAMKYAFKNGVFTTEEIAKYLKVEPENIEKLLNWNSPFFVDNSLKLKIINFSKYDLYSQSTYDKFNSEFDKRYPGYSNYRFKTLIGEYYWMSENMCGIGLDKIMEFLSNRKNDSYAKLILKLLECEITNAEAKIAQLEYDYESMFECYSHKNILLSELRKMCNRRKILCGKQYSDIMPYVVYFDIPIAGQISFHSDLFDWKKWENYPKEWDKLINSTFVKIEYALNQQYPKQFKKIKCKNT